MSIHPVIFDVDSWLDLPVLYEWVGCHVDTWNIHQDAFNVFMQDLHVAQIGAITCISTSVILYGCGWLVYVIWIGWFLTKIICRNVGLDFVANVFLCIWNGVSDLVVFNTSMDCNRHTACCI